MDSILPVKLGLMPPLTGLVGIYGPEIARAGMIACQEINENGGILGRPLELIIEDDGSLPESAIVAAEKLVDRDHCTAIIGNLLSNARIAVAYRVAEPRKIPYLNFSFYEGSIVSPYFFHFAALPNQQIERMIPYMRNKFGPRMFFAGNNYEWPRGSIHAGKAALEEVGGIAVGEEYCPIGVSEAAINNLLDQVEKAAPDVFVPYFAGVDQLTLLTKFTERGLKKNISVVMGHYDEMMASNLSPQVREGFYSSNTYFMSVDTAANKSFLKRLSEFTGVDELWPQGNGIITNFGEGTYVCVKAFAKAANKAGSLETAALIEALETIKLEAPQGTVQMNPKHHHARVNTYLTRCEANGNFTMVEEFGAIEPILPDRYSHQAVQQSTTMEEDLRLQARILGLMSEGVFLVRVDDQSVVYANPGAERMFGYDAGEMLGLSISEFCLAPEGDTKLLFADILSVLINKGEWLGEIQINGKDGLGGSSSLSSFAFTHPVFGESWLFVATDITERKNIENKIGLINKRMSLATDAAGIGVWDLDLVKNELIWDDWMFRLYGVKEEEFGGAFDAWQKGVHPEDLERSSAEVEQAIGGKRDFDTEFRIINPITGVRHLKANAIIVRDVKGIPLRMIGINFDITDRKVTEEKLIKANDELEERVEERTRDIRKLSRAVEQSPNAVFITNTDGTIEYVNSSFSNLTGFSADEAIGQNPRILKSDKTPRDIYKDLWKTIQSGNEWRGEINDRRKDGRDFWAYETIAPVKDEDGKITHFVATHEDITERKKSELKILEATEQAEIANRAKSELMANMSHELRTPLNAIIGFSDTMKEEIFGSVGSDKNREYLDDINDSGQHLLELINDILDVSAIEAGAIELQEETVCLSKVTDAAIRLIKARAEKGQVKITASIDSKLPKVYADERRVKQVLLNLLSNAVKFTPEGGEVSIDGWSNGNGSVAITVSDTGMGMNEEEMSTALGRFGQVDSGLDRKHEGTGLGLPLTKGLMELHGGTLELKSKKGRGSQITVTFPKERLIQNVG